MTIGSSLLIGDRWPEAKCFIFLLHHTFSIQPSALKMFLFHFKVYWHILFCSKAMDNKAVNKDLILREKLAIERTEMANDRTLLSFIRTGLYFSIAGITINELLQPSYGLLLEIFFWAVAVLIVVTGVYKYLQQKKKIANSKKHIGNYILDWDEEGLV